MSKCVNCNKPENSEEPSIIRFIRDRLFAAIKTDDTRGLMWGVDELGDRLGGVNCKGECPSEESLLHTAAFKGNERIILFLLQRGALIRSTDYQKRTPLHFAASSVRATILRMLLLEMINQDKSNKEPLRTLDMQDTQGDTALHLAVRSCRLKNIQFLLEYGANANIKNKEGQTPLDVARSYANANNDYSLKNVVRILEKWEQDPTPCIEIG
jgi:hypothetical protein